MKQFEKWWKLNWWGSVKEERKDITEAAWKAALEWVLKNRLPYYDLDDKKVVATDSDIIYKEVEE